MSIELFLNIITLINESNALSHILFEVYLLSENNFLYIKEKTNKIIQNKFCFVTFLILNESILSFMTPKFQTIFKK